MRVELGKGEESIRAMKVYVDGEDHGWITTADKTQYTNCCTSTRTTRAKSPRSTFHG